MREGGGRRGEGEKGRREGKERRYRREVEMNNIFSFRQRAWSKSDPTVSRRR